MSQLNQKHVDIAAQVKPLISLGEAGTFTVTGDLIEAVPREGYSKEAVVGFQDYASDLLSGILLAFGESSVAAFKADKKLEQVSIEVPFGNDVIAGSILRSKEYPAGGVPKEGEKRDPNAMVTKWGVSTMRYGVSANANRGSLKKVREHINAIAAEALSK